MRHSLSLAQALAALAAAPLGLLPQPAFSQATRAFVHERDVTGRFTVGVDAPLWTGRSLLGYDLDRTAAPVLYSVDRNGKRDEFQLKLPGAKMVAIRGIAGGADGAIVVSGGAYSSEAQGTTFLAWISPDRKTQLITRLWPYVAEKTVIAVDGTIWTAGFLKNEANDRVVAVNQFRRFDKSGKQLASFTVRSKESKQLAGDGTSYSWLGASTDRIGWLSNGNEYIEFSLDGTEIQRFDGPVELVDAPTRLHGGGISSDNEVAVGVATKDGLKVFTLDRNRRAWNMPLQEEKTSFRVAGFDGNTLVTLPNVGEAGIMRRYGRKDLPARQQPQDGGAGGR